MEPIGAVGNAGMVLAQLGTQATAPEAADATRFAEMVGAAPAPAQATAPADPAAVGQTPGDSILGGMSSLGTGFRDSWVAMQQALSQPAMEMTIADMLRMQMHMVSLSVQVELVGKTVSKATQNLDQLAKLQ